MTPHLYTFKEACEILRMGHTWLYKLCETKQITHRRSSTGKKSRIFFTQDDIEKFLRERKVA